VFDIEPIIAEKIGVSKVCYTDRKTISGELGGSAQSLFGEIV